MIFTWQGALVSAVKNLNREEGTASILVGAKWKHDYPLIQLLADFGIAEIEKANNNTEE